MNNLISNLSGKLEILENKVDGESVEWSEDGYNYLAIGNSITLHEFATYWWDDDRGMASSRDDKDYVHLVENYLKNNQSEVMMHATNFATWETQGTDRAEFLGLLNKYLSNKINLITIQLGENASNLDSWETDFEELITYVQDKAPGAEILVIGDFWSKGERYALKEKAANAKGVTYISLEGVKDNKDYFVGLGAYVEDSEGNMHIIEHGGVAAHPGDKGMEAIAERIIKELKE